MKVLVACEFSGIVRDAFIGRGHDAISCDLLPTERPGPHYQGDVRDMLAAPWDLLIAHPPCTDLAVSGARWFAEKQADGRQWEALQFVRELLDAEVPGIREPSVLLTHELEVRVPLRDGGGRVGRSDRGREHAGRPARHAAGDAADDETGD